MITFMVLCNKCLQDQNIANHNWKDRTCGLITPDSPAGCVSVDMHLWSQCHVLQRMSELGSLGTRLMNHTCGFGLVYNWGEPG